MTPRRSKAGKARKYYAHPDDIESGKDLYLYGLPKVLNHYTHPVAVFSLSPEDELARVEGGTRAVHKIQFGRSESWGKRASRH